MRRPGAGDTGRGGYFERREDYAHRPQLYIVETPEPELHAAGDTEDFAGDPAGVVGCQEERDRRDVLCLCDATQRRLRNGELFKLATDDATRVRALSRHNTRTAASACSGLLFNQGDR